MSAAGIVMPLCLVAGWSLSEAILWFIVADVPVSWISVRRGTQAGVIAAVVAATGAMVGGSITYAWAAEDSASLADLLDRVPAISPAFIAHVDQVWREEGYGGMLKASFSGIPYKLFAAAAGEQGSPLAQFLPASFAARLPRFLLVAAVSGVISRKLTRHMAIPGRLAILVATWTIFYAWYFSVMDG